MNKHQTWEENRDLGEELLTSIKQMKAGEHQAAQRRRFLKLPFHTPISYVNYKHLNECALDWYLRYLP